MFLYFHKTYFFILGVDGFTSMARVMCSLDFGDNLLDVHIWGITNVY